MRDSVHRYLDRKLMAFEQFLELITAFPDLHSVASGTIVGAWGLSALTRLTSLRELRLGYGLGSEFLRGMPQLRVIELHQIHSPIRACWFSTLDRLFELQLRDCQVEDDGLKGLEACSGLHTLCISHAHIKRLDSLSCLRQLRTLSLAYCRDITDTSLTAVLPHLNSLTDLDISATRVAGHSLIQLPQPLLLTRLQYHSQALFQSPMGATYISHFRKYVRELIIRYIIYKALYLLFYMHDGCLLLIYFYYFPLLVSMLCIVTRTFHPGSFLYCFIKFASHRSLSNNLLSLFLTRFYNAKHLCDSQRCARTPLMYWGLRTHCVGCVCSRCHPRKGVPKSFENSHHLVSRWLRCDIYVHYTGIGAFFVNAFFVFFLYKKRNLILKLISKSITAEIARLRAAIVNNAAPSVQQIQVTARCPVYS